MADDVSIFCVRKNTGNDSSNTVLVVSCWGFSHYYFQFGRDLSRLPVKMNQYHGMTSQGFKCNSFECMGLGLAVERKFYRKISDVRA